MAFPPRVRLCQLAVTEVIPSISRLRKIAHVFDCQAGLRGFPRLLDFSFLSFNVEGIKAYPLRRRSLCAVTKKNTRSPCVHSVGVLRCFHRRGGLSHCLALATRKSTLRWKFLKFRREIKLSRRLSKTEGILFAHRSSWL